MTRIPEAGRVKTRLIPALGGEGAARLHGQLLHRALTTAGEHAEASNVAVEVRYTGAPGVRFPREDYPPVAIVRQQQGADLGERLLSAVRTAKAEGAQGVVIIGTDCPDLSPEVLELAWQELAHASVVIGPAENGGYYLIALNEVHEELFRGIDWETEHVLSQSLARCQEAGLSVALLPRLNDVDLPEDLVTCRRIGAVLEQCFPRSTAGLLSVIIPTLNEVHNLRDLVEPLLAAPDCEVIVVNGGSTDGTPELACYPWNEQPRATDECGNGTGSW
ncbi:MAG: TIGR04282 family arsenosugar biosynthesis glycosyltransferase [Planctomycetales bacterium]|nr:TIGR04282 family arsenosugar biosynthesis glycosyltransferase [Planctomycetales bacterium]